MLFPAIFLYANSFGDTLDIVGIQINTLGQQISNMFQSSNQHLAIYFVCDAILLTNVNMPIYLAMIPSSPEKVIYRGQVQ